MLFQTLPVTQPTHVYTKLLLFHPPTDRPTDLSPEIGEEVLRRRLPRRHRDAQPLQVVPGERVAVGDGVDAAVHGDPNLFRRLLGEGALASAIVPIFSDILNRSGRSRAFAFLNQVMVRLLMVLIALIASGMILLSLLSNGGLLSEHWALSADLAVIILPYMLFICLAAIVSTGLNLIGRFAVAASTPMLLNISIIGSLLIGMWLEGEPARIVYWLCGGVLFGGFLQLAVPFCDLAYQGWRPKLGERLSAEVSELWQLFVPGLFGAAILQVNILLSRLLAYSLDESAVSVSPRT